VEDNKLKISRIMYILEAAFEYLITIPVTGSYLATLTGYIGMTDSLTGIMSSIVSLGCLFQLLSLLFHPKRVKAVVIALSIFNQMLFMLLYMVPFINVNTGTKNIIFIVLIILAYLIYNIAHPKKIAWLMSLVDDEKRGSFTANKEIVSLISGMVFTFVLGNVIDAFEAKGDMKAAFLLCMATIFVLTTLHTITMLFSVERNTKSKKITFKSAFNTIKDKKVLKITVVFVLWNIAYYSAFPFYGSYNIKELGFSLGFVSVITIISSFCRILVSRLWGKYADKNSFAKMIVWCMLIAMLGFLAASFSTPQTGKIFQTAYMVLNAVAMGGINSALINLVFDYTTPEHRSDALAVNQAFSGLAGFLSTLAASVLVTHIQKNSNTLFGVKIYAQQVMSLVAFCVTVVTVLYVYFAIVKKGEKNDS